MKKSVYVKEDLKSVILHYAEVNTYFFLLIFFLLPYSFHFYTMHHVFFFGY